MIIKSMYKYELARAADASMDDFRKWLQMPAQVEAFKRMGIPPTAHKLPPIAVKYCIENYGIDLPE